MLMWTHIRNARLIDPFTKADRSGELWLCQGRIAAPPSPLPRPGECIDIDATGLVVAPAFIDLHVHFREPGNEAAETVFSGARAAARGGFSTVVTMPNTQPPIDRPDRFQQQLNLAAQQPFVTILPSACLTHERAGREPADLAALAQAGAIAFTDDGSTVPDEALFETLAREAHRLNRPILDHALDHNLAANGVMHAGDRAQSLGMPGISSEAEFLIVARDIRLAERTGCVFHIQHLSARESVDLIRSAQQRSLPVSAEATPHHLDLTDADVQPDSADAKMAPPLRSAEDREALLQAVAEGVISCLATDHAPHTAEAKARGLQQGPFGIVGLETAIGITYPLLVRSGRMSLMEWIRRWTTGPARILNIPQPSLGIGSSANLVFLDLEKEWTVCSANFVSLSRNTPWDGRRCIGRAIGTIRNGRWTWRE
jgi:dihydroorotase